jgi:hypothetical protein
MDDNMSHPGPLAGKSGKSLCTCGDSPRDEIVAVPDTEKEIIGRNSADSVLKVSSDKYCGMSTRC